MAKIPLQALLSIALVMLTLFVIILPELNNMFVKAEEDVVTRVLEHFTQPELYGIEELDLSGEWVYTIRDYEEGLLEGLYRPDAPVEEWREIKVPFMYVATSRNSTIWLRREFRVSEELKGRRIRLVFLGAFYKAEVWVNGIHLGRHEGYFSPFFFDIADVLVYGDVNVLVVCLSTPVELDLSNKQGVVGIYNDWDMKPYPRWALGKLPPKYEWVVPIGLWKPVKLVVSGPVAVTAVLVDASYEEASRTARVRLRFYVSNVGDPTEASLSFTINPYNFDGRGASGTLSFSLGEGERKWVEASITIPEAKLWWTWDQGDPSLYSLRYEVRAGGRLQGRGATLFGVREIDGTISPLKARIELNHKPVFLRGVNYVSDFLLGRVTPEVLRHDLEMMRKANVNFVRVHAHVEPPEFYSLTDEAGMAVQADGPLIWAYASRLKGRGYSEFLKRVQETYTEMVLLLYNHPSVIIWTVHNEPPWASPWMGKLYKMNVNRDLDELLASLISMIDGHNRVVIKGSGYEDQHVYYGWFTGSWLDFREDSSPFPTEFGAESLPSTNSPFWKLVNISHWPIISGSDEYYELAYRCFYWASGYVEIPYGLPSDYESLEDYIRASQEYQALLLKTAISRYRILKFNVTAGLAAFMFRDCFPAATFSVVDYFGIPKLAYYTLAEEYRPLKVIVEWGGDFVVKDTKIIYTPNSTIGIRIWVVNDLEDVEGEGVVYWKLVDLNDSRVIAEGRRKTAIPSSDEPAKLVASLKLSTPIFLDGHHSIELRVQLVNEDGEKLDSESIHFTVMPASKVTLILEGASEPLEFLVRADGLTFYVKSREGRLSFTLPAGVRALLAGPKLDLKAPYLPLSYDLGVLEPGGVTYSVKMVKSALYVLRTPMPSADETRPPTLEFHVTPLEKLEGPYILSYTPSNAELMFMLGYTGNSFPIPAEIPVNVSYIIRGERRSFSVVRGPLKLAPGQVFDDFDLAQKLASEALEASERMLRLAKSRLKWVSRRGFYLGLSEQWVERAEMLTRKAEGLLEKEPEVAITCLREACELLENVVRRAAEVYSEARTSFPLLTLVLLLSSLGAASLLVEEESKRPLVGTAILVALGLTVYLAYPGIHEISSIELLSGLYISFFFFMMIFLVPRLLEDLKSERGLPVFAAISAALSIASRNLCRRSLRTILALVSILSMAIAVTNLSSISYYVMSRELVTTARVPVNVDNAIMAFKEGAFGLSELVYVASQPEVLEFGFKIDSVPRVKPYCSVALRAVRAFTSFYGYTPYREELLKLVEPPSALALVATRSDAVIVSRSWRQSGVEVGDTIVVEGIKLRIVGFYDPDGLGTLKDLGGHDFLPEAIMPDGSLGLVHPDEMIVVSPEVATKLGGRVTRVYAKTRNPLDAIEVARRLSMQTGYTVVARPAGDLIRTFYVGPTVEFRGSEAFLPMTLAFLNVGTIVLASVYERRKEIFTLASVGLNPTHIFLVFLSEALLLGFVGGSLGYLTGFILFRALQVTGPRIPVDVKTGVVDMVMVVGLSTISSIVAAVVPAMKASAYATPSLRRRWRLEAERIGEDWIVEIPARIPAEKAELFADFVVERFREESGIEVAVWGVELVKRFDEGGRRLYEISFTYGRGGNRPFRAVSKLVVRPVSEEFYGVTLLTRPESVYMRFSQSYVQEVASFVRTLVLEWASLRVRLLAPVGLDSSNVIELIRHYNPQLVIVVTRKGDRRLLRSIRRKVRGMGLRPPAMELVELRGEGVDEILDEVRRLMSKADIIGLDSDDGTLSAIVALAAALEKRRVSVFRDGKIEELSVDKLVGLAG